MITPGKKIFLLLITCGFLFAIPACKKEADQPPPVIIKEDDLIGVWLLIAETINPGLDVNGDGILDFNSFPFYQPCELDDLVIFRQDKSGEYNEGETKCHSGDAQLKSAFFWSLRANQLILEFGPTLQVAEVLSADGETLKMSYTVKDSNINYTGISTYRKK